MGQNLQSISKICLYVCCGTLHCRNCKEYKGSDDPDWVSGPLHSKSAPVIKGVGEADKALKLSQEDRLSLVVELLPSEDEEDMECKLCTPVLM